jgi:hypothetical protein
MSHPKRQPVRNFYPQFLGPWTFLCWHLRDTATSIARPPPWPASFLSILDGRNSMAPPPPKSLVARITSCCCCCHCQHHDCCDVHGLFAVHGTSDRLLNVPATFSPRGVVAFVIKLLLLGLSVTSMILAVMYTRGSSLLFVAYLTNWALIWTVLYSLLSFCNSVRKIKQPSSSSSSSSPRTTTGGGSDAAGFVGVRAAATWLLFTLAAHTQMMASLLYWALVHQPEWGCSFGTIMFHGGLLLVLLLEGQTMNRIPIRWNHFPFVFAFHFIYLVWATLVHGTYEIGNPDRRGPVAVYSYDVVDWTGNPPATLSLALIVQLGIVPILYGILFVISLPCRRYRKQSKRKKQQRQTASKPVDGLGGGGARGRGTDDAPPQEEQLVYTRLSDDSSSSMESSDSLFFASRRADDQFRSTVEIV